MKKTILTLTLSILGLSNVYSQVGIGTTSPDASAILELDDTTKGFLPPRMTTAQRDDIASPAEGLTIYNTDANCLQWYNGTGWYDVCDGSIFVPPVIGIPGNATCVAATISVTPCSAVSGATLNNDPTTGDGTEYDWTGATGFVDGGATQALVEIGGQCWYRRNAVNTPSAYDPEPTWVNSSDVGWSGDYLGGPFANEGKLYQWSAAMNGSTTERAQGVCPTGWHVPSDCEWMYLEDTLGMTVAEQQATGFRGTEGQDLTTLVTGGTNSSGFTALLPGYRFTVGTFNGRGTLGVWWSSSEASTTNANAQSRAVNSSQAGVSRVSSGKAGGFSVRCLKD